MAKRKKSQEYSSEFKNILEYAEQLNSSRSKTLDDEDELGIDPKQTLQQNKRDRKMTELFGQYLVSYINKVNFVKEKKNYFFYITMGWASFIILGSVLLPIIYFILNRGVEDNGIDIAGIVASIVTFAGIIFGIVKIVAQYLFSPDDEKNITDIVKSIQQNDLENKKVNLQYSSQEEQKENKPKKNKYILNLQEFPEDDK